MSQLIYLDTNIYLDYFENRNDYLRPLGEFAFNLLRKTINCEFDILISSLLNDEIRANGYQKQMQELISVLEVRHKVINVEISVKDKVNAAFLSKQHNKPFSDVLHYFIAKKNNAELFVTRNIKDFPTLDGYPEIVFPENI